MTDVMAIRAEINALAVRRADAMLQDGRHVTDARPCPSHAALLHRVASLITTEELPAADIRIHRIGPVSVDCSGSELVQSDVRRWAAALDLPVTEGPWDVNGYAATRWAAQGGAHGMAFTISGYQLLPTPMTDRFGIGRVSS